MAIAVWVYFSLIFGAIVHKIVRVKVSPDASWFESGLLGTIVGAILFPILWAALIFASMALAI